MPANQSTPKTTGATLQQRQEPEKILHMLDKKGTSNRIAAIFSLTVAVVVCSLTIANAKSAKPAPVERRLYAKNAEASSFLRNDWNRFRENYHPNYILDGDPKTAWTEGVDGQGEKESISVRFTEMANTTELRLKIRNGYQKTKRLFSRNSRIKQATITLLPSGKTQTLTLKDARGWQTVRVASSGTLHGFRLTVESVFPGTHYDDTCISDVQIYVTSTTRENPSFERSNRRALLDWKRARLRAARLFSGKNAKHIPVATGYHVTADEKLKPEAKTGPRYARFANPKALLRSARNKFGTSPLLEFAIKELATDLVKWKRVRVSLRDKRPLPAVDGITWNYYGARSDFRLPRYLGYLHANKMRRISGGTKQLNINQYWEREEKLCTSEDPITNFWSISAADGSLRGLFVIRCQLIEEREGLIPDSEWKLLVYNKSGQLKLLVGHRYVTQLTWARDPQRPILQHAQRVSGSHKRPHFHAISERPVTAKAK